MVTRRKWLTKELYSIGCSGLHTTTWRLSEILERQQHGRHRTGAEELLYRI